MGTATDFSARTEAMLARAAAQCESRGARLTELRREVLGLILEAPLPAGAYDLLDRLRARRGAATPPTVYRALDFLLEQGLIHRVERLSAFVGCVSHGEDHAAQFLICRTCGQVQEIEDVALVAALTDAAGRAGFALGRATVEAEGRCAHCAGAAPPPLSARSHAAR
jgi:Fur family zinc uptake transcriptional regulator